MWIQVKALSTASGKGIGVLLGVTLLFPSRCLEKQEAAEHVHTPPEHLGISKRCNFGFLPPPSPSPLLQSPFFASEISLGVAFVVVVVSALDLMASNCTKEGSGWILGRSFSLKQFSGIGMA